ncbi:hypothetical protein HDU67_007259 [Dinochytrium kinnereticum]|nr:hypothetical protein HDU67_007259 [Dinochytrium kinnereticum]
MRLLKCWFRRPEHPKTSHSAVANYDKKPSKVASMQVKTESSSLPEAEEEIKEFHFHVYWITSDASARAAALNFRKEILRLNEAKFFVAVPLERVNEGPMGPHPMGSYEVWCPTEYFARVYQWMARNRPSNVSIFIHPLSKEQLLDHTYRASFLGPSMPLYLETLQPPTLDHYPRQYPELQLGYSAPCKQ